MESRWRVCLRRIYLMLGYKTATQWSWGHHLHCLIFSHLFGSSSTNSQGKLVLLRSQLAPGKNRIKRPFLNRSQLFCPRKSEHGVMWSMSSHTLNKSFLIETHQDKGCLSLIYKFMPQTLLNGKWSNVHLAALLFCPAHIWPPSLGPWVLGLKNNLPQQKWL